MMKGFLLIIFVALVASSNEVDVPKKQQDQEFEVFAKYFFEKYGEKLMGPPGLPGIQENEIFVQNILKRISLLEEKIEDFIKNSNIF